MSQTPKAAENPRSKAAPLPEGRAPGPRGAPRARLRARPPRVGRAGLPIGVRFAFGMSASIAFVMVLGGLLIFYVSNRSLLEVLKVSGVGASQNLAAWPLEFTPTGPEEVRGETSVVPVRYKVAGIEKAGILYRQPRRDPEGRMIGRADILIPEESFEVLQADMLLLLFCITVVLIAVASIVAWLVGKRVTAPLTQIVSDIDIISKGDLDHKTRVHGGGETGMLAQAVDRMAAGLKAARQTELELQKRQHDLAVASEVRQSLLPEKIAQAAGYEIAGSHKASQDVGGDYYDVVPIEGSDRVALLVAEVAGKGISAALVMTMARAYLRAELQRHPSPYDALAAANRSLSRDMRRGMYVTALCVLLDPQAGKAQVVSAGHKVPLVHWTAAEGSLRVVTPPGIALGFDPGPVFERTLKEAAVTMAPGDRLVLSTSAPLAAKNRAGEELGERGFYALLKHEASKNSEAFLNRVLYGLEKFQGGAPMPGDIAIATARRTAG